MKIAIIYHSSSGNTESIATLMEEHLNQMNHIEAKKMTFENVDDKFVEASKGILFGCPTYCGSYSWQLKKWFDTTNVSLDGKIGSVFVSENYLGGGADIAELGIIGMMLVRGMLAYSAGFTKGHPFTHLGAISIQSGTDEQQKRSIALCQRLSDKVLELWG